MRLAQSLPSTFSLASPQQQIGHILTNLRVKLILVISATSEQLKKAPHNGVLNIIRFLIFAMHTKIPEPIVALCQCMQTTLELVCLRAIDTQCNLYVRALKKRYLKVYL